MDKPMPMARYGLEVRNWLVSGADLPCVTEFGSLTALAEKVAGKRKYVADDGGTIAPT